MLTFHSCSLQVTVPAHDPQAGAIPPEVSWIDLFDPTPDEIAFVQRTTGLTIPSRAQLSEIETSSRLRLERNALVLGVPAIYRPKEGPVRMTPVGFLLSQDRLITVRFEDIASFTDFKVACDAADPLPSGSVGILIGLFEAMVDRLADGLESASDDLEIISHKIFGDPHGRSGRKIAEATFRAVLRRIGRRGDFTSHLRTTLLGIGRAVPYVLANATWIKADAREHLAGLRQDIDSLNEFEARLSDKVQFLLDATLGFITIEQQDTFKVLTVASVIGIPPTLIASMYGMNFKTMPELDWAYGYPYVLVLIVLSACLPAAWLKWKGYF